jgi:hypothetical protein
VLEILGSFDASVIPMHVRLASITRT